MGLPSGNFSHPQPGRLRVIFGGLWGNSSGDPILIYGSWDLVLRAYVGSGAGRLTSLLSMGVNSAVIERDYPGAYAIVPVGMEFVSYNLAGAGTVWATDLSVSCHLVR